jgi:hypothetical protein
VRDDGRRVERFTKRTLVAVSHAIERAALAHAEDTPMVVAAMFQRLPYFDRERAVYQQIAARAAVTVVGLVGGVGPEMPPGAYHASIGEQEELAREWSVAVLTPRFGAVLVAHDLEQVDPQAWTLEGGRLFDGWWGFRRDEALHEVIRLRNQLAHRLPHTAVAGIDSVLDRVRDLPATPGEGRAEASVRLLVDRMERADRRTRALRQRLEATRQPDTEADLAAGLVARGTMHRWSGEQGVTASGTLPVALVGVRITEPAEAPARLGRRSAARELQTVLGAITTGLRPVDRAMRLAVDEFLLVLPSLSSDEAVAVAYRVGQELAGLAETYPFVAFTCNAVVTVTRRRPLPVEEIRQALDWAVAQGVPVAALPPEQLAAPGAGPG